jgi:hypothetical protein
MEKTDTDNLFEVNDLGSMNSDKIKEGDNKKFSLKKYLIFGISISIIIITVINIIVVTLSSNQSSNDKNNNKIG